MEQASRILSGMTGSPKTGPGAAGTSPGQPKGSPVAPRSRSNTPRKLREYADVAKTRLDRVVQVCTAHQAFCRPGSWS